MVNQRTWRDTCLVILLVALAVAAVTVGGCATTQQANLWVDPSYHARPMSKILVIAMRKDQLRRRMWEDAVVSALTGEGHGRTGAVASYQLFANEVPDTLGVRQKTKDEGFDGVLLIAKARRDTLTNDVPGYTSSKQVTTYSRRWDTYVTHWEDVYHPSYTETETNVSVRTDLLIPQEDGKLVWSVTSQSVDPTSEEQFRSSVADRVASQLKKKHLIY